MWKLIAHSFLGEDFESDALHYCLRSRGQITVQNGSFIDEVIVGNASFNQVNITLIQ